MTAHMTGAALDEVWPLIRDHHYSKKMPSAVQHAFAWRLDGGLFGDYGECVAAALYGIPVNRNWPSDALELQRLVRKPDCTQPLSQFLAWTLRWLRSHSDAPFVISYADSAENHHGGIYQATGWTYVAERTEAVPAFLLPDGTKKHSRQVNRELGSRSVAWVAERRPDWVPVKGQPKFLYVRPLRQNLNGVLRRYGWTPLPYPKPNADRPVDAGIPMPVSEVQPLGSAPSTKENAA
jgi:hypothetical protein